MRRFDHIVVWRLGLLATVAFLVLYPLCMLFFGSFRSAMPGLPGEYGIEGYIKVYSDPGFYSILWTTIWIAAIKTVLCMALVIFLAWFIHRTDAPGRNFLEIFIFFTFFLLPPLPAILGWILIFAPNSGFANQLFLNIVGSPLFNIFSVPGIIFVSVASTFPFYYIFLAPAFKHMDATLEEAAMTSGASPAATIFRVTLPLVMPAILSTSILAFVRGMAGFEVPLFVGLPGRIYVLPTKIFDYLQEEPPLYPSAMAAGVTLLLATFMLVLLQRRILGRRDFTTVTGKGYKPRLMKLGPWRYPLFILAQIIVLGLNLPPMIILIETTFMRVAGVYMPDMYTLRNYASAFTKPAVWAALRNTAILGVSAATMGMILCTVVSYVAVRTEFREKRVLDIIAWTPWAVPSIVLALGFLWAYILLPRPGGVILYGTIWVLILAIITHGLPIGTRTMSSGMMQVSKELEEAARMQGASWARTLICISLPLLKHSFISGWIIIFSFGVKDLATVVLLYSAKSEVLSTIFFNFWRQGSVETACVVGLLQTGLMAAGFILTRLLSGVGVKEIDT